MVSRLEASALLAMVLVVAGFAAGAQDRMPPLPKEQLTDEQTQALAEFVAARGQPTGPWNVLLRSPELMKRTRGLSDYLRFESPLPGYLREFVILMTARQWGQNYEWNAHYPLAIDEGFSAEMAQAIVEGRRPDGMLEDEEILYDFVLELQRNHSVSDATYERAVERFGEQGVVETVSLVGYYTMISMILNTARTPLPPDAVPALDPFPY
ncbi:MAG TPA: carboxymuconolactone decarboxylase family protein [Gammaproteobacteria bacterium]|nr:carboxymuconolactone decarboxylase family protein [Gammaproteobacteria bacterium]